MIIEKGDDPGPFSTPRNYVSYLRECFRRRCAYCLAPDDRLGGEEGMKVDHFMPESRYKHLRLAWTNLYYSCDVCNNR
ncbi:MAG: HNH endonuclease, partial [Planctomycetota bacterium]|nr:HNH endonuclease [Planctomycetota bacterium]